MTAARFAIAVSFLLAACDNRSLPVSDAGLEAGPKSDTSPPPVADGGGGGCLDNAGCAPLEYCTIEGACAVTGAKLGSCAPRPEGCDTMYAPVCGCDGKTHGNACAAAMAGVNVSYQGECKPGRCGNLMFLPACPATEVCDFTSCGAAEGSCVKKPTPIECAAMSGPVVCGCDGKTYATDCERLLAGVARASFGACPAGGIKVVTDAAEYASGQNVKATLSNGTAASVFLAGCAAYAIERKEGGVFVDKGSTVDCAWEGNAKEVKPGASLTETVYPFQGGTYRIRAEYGLGCTPGKPLSSAGCASFAAAHSVPFVVKPDAKACASLVSAYASALSGAKTCDPSINMPQCLVLAAGSLGCGCETFVNTTTALTPLVQKWKDLGCPDCAPGSCTKPASGACVGGLCQDTFQ